MSEQTGDQQEDRTADPTDGETEGSPVASGTGPDEAALHQEDTGGPESPVLETEGDQDRFDAG